MHDQRFAGFPHDTMSFLADLQANNDRTWFAANRQRYEQAFRGPAEAFVALATPEIEALAGRPVSAKIFRIHRDVRFSKDKSPFNAHLHIGFTLARAEGRAAPTSPDYYFGLKPERLFLGAGVFELSGADLDRYRAAASADEAGAELTSLLADLAQDGLAASEPVLKRVPAPYPADHPRAELLRRKGLAAWREIGDRSVIEGPALFAETMATFSRAAPLNRWLEAALRPG